MIPYTRALLSNSVLPESQAQMFAGLSGIESIGTLLSPLFSLGYSLTVGAYGEGMFLVMSALTGVSALIMFHIRNQKLIQSEQHIHANTNTAENNDDMKEPMLAAEGRASPGATGAPASAFPRAHSIASNATYGDRQISLSVSMAF